MTREIPEAEMSMLDTLHTIAAGHAGVSHERLVLLDLDPERYPGQRLSETTIRAGKDGPLKPEYASAIANDIDPRYPALEHLFLKRHHETAGLQRIIELARGGNNVINGSDHAELVDIAFSHLALAGIVKRSVNVRTGIVLSKMADFLGIEMDNGIVPVRELLALGFDRSFLTIPRTQSTEGKFDDDDLSDYNQKVRKKMASALDRKSFLNKRQAPFLLGIALPGSVNKPLLHEGEEEITVIGHVADGTLSVTSVPNTEVVATSIRLDAEDPKFFIDELPMRLETHDDIVRLMGRMVAGIQALDGGNYIYDENGDQPTRKPHTGPSS